VTTADEQLKFQIALTLLPGVGPVLAKNLVSYCGSVEEIFKKKKSHLEKIPGIGHERASEIISVEKKIFQRAEEEIKFIRKHNITPLFYTDEKYPARLKNCDDAPPLIFFKGKCELNASRMIAIVGTRKASEYGKEITEQFVNDFVKYDATIVSGLAYVIDIIAHKAAVKNNLPTIGVLAHGLDRLYPATHKSTAEKMVKNGGVLTEYLTQTNPDRENFPSRNRIVAGMCDAVIVVESAIKGGALITAVIANSYNRDVFAVPGRAGDFYSEGCNEFIRLNKAALITNADQLAQMMMWETDATEKKSEPKQLKIFQELKEEERILVDLLHQKGKLNIDIISIHANMPMSKVSSTLLNLEFAGVLKSLPGKMFELL
jgi:DNA processing protein